MTIHITCKQMVTKYNRMTSKLELTPEQTAPHSGGYRLRLGFTFGQNLESRALDEATRMSRYPCAG